MSFAKRNTLFHGALLLAVSSVLAAEPLKTPPAPFASIPKSPETENADDAKPARPYLDADRMTFVFGSKKVVVAPGGTFVVMSGGRKLADSYFSVSTPAKSWNTNRQKKIVKKYDGSGLCVTSCKADAAAGTIRVEGQIAFHKPGDPEILHGWERTFSLQPDGKLRIQTLLHAPPELMKYGSAGIFFKFNREKDYTSTPVKRLEKVPSHRTNDISVVFNAPGDDFKIEVHSNMIQQKRKSSASLYLTPIGKEWILILDPGKYGKAEKPMPGGVNFKKSDDLTLPTAGKNLLANPYFAQGYAFVRDSMVGDWMRDTNDQDLVKDQARFGKYCLKAGSYYTQTIPADPGDYVFSVYVKGKGTLTVSAAGKAPWKNVVSKKFKFQSPDQWKRIEMPFKFPNPDMLSITYALSGEGLLDGIQLEKGSKATEFSAPAVTARFITTPENGFLESGKPMSGYLELSTLKQSVSGTAEISIRNFFGETVRKQSFQYSFGKGKYPREDVDLKGLPDGVYVIEVSYRGAGAKAGEKQLEHFRFSIMPFLKNKHFTRRIFSPMYGGGYDGMVKTISSRYLKRWQQVGFGVYGHAPAMTNEVADKMKSFGVLPFDGGCVKYSNSKNVAENFPNLNVPPGRFFFYTRDPDRWFRKAAVFPDYRLVGGWSADYRKKFKDSVKKELSKAAEKKVFYIGSEWAAEIKNDPHYPDLVAAYFEAVRELYPNAMTAEAGGMNMFPHDGIRQVDQFLERFLKKGYKKPDFLMGHPYTGKSGMPTVFENFKALLKVAEKHGMGDCQLAFAEGMHFYAYDIPEWGCNFMSAENWRLRGTFSYDMGWIERLSGAYYARFWLVHLTEFHRMWCVTSAMVNTNNFIMDNAFTPRAGQKIPNTLGTLFPHPKRYLGDCSFAPETRCLVWEDHEGRPIAAVWNENAEIDAGLKAAPDAEFSYRGAEYIDLMGAVRKPAKDGVFPVSPFPLFIRGRKGDCDAFVKAIRQSVLHGGTMIPFHIADKITGDGALELTLTNNLAGTISGNLTIGNQKKAIDLAPHKAVKLKFKLPTQLSDSRVSPLKFPMVWDNGRETIKRNFTSYAFLVRPFKGSWDKIPVIPLTNRNIRRGAADDGFAASLQMAWTKEKLLLRISVKDDHLSAGSGNRNRWNNDVVQVFFDTLCSARRTGRKLFDDDDYDFSLMPTEDGKRCEVFRSLSPFMQYTLGTAKAKDNTIATEIKASFTRTADGYVYLAEFPGPYIRPIELEPGWNMGFCVNVADRDKGPNIERSVSLSTEPRVGGWNRPQTWPIAVLSE